MSKVKVMNEEVMEEVVAQEVTNSDGEVTVVAKETIGSKVKTGFKKHWKTIAAIAGAAVGGLMVGVKLMGNKDSDDLEVVELEEIEETIE